MINTIETYGFYCKMSANIKNESLLVLKLTFKIIYLADSLADKGNSIFLRVSLALWDILFKE